MNQIKVILQSLDGSPLDEFRVGASELTMSLARLPDTERGVAEITRTLLEDCQYLWVNFDPAAPPVPPTSRKPAEPSLNSLLDQWSKE